ncbi:recombinase family protein [Isoptericola sediminis]|uniref:Recombinase family protein n=1 Tax=Isoptericola sediminis TaxID=2733572 RepID=A0A849K0X5_9MICO|nr:recombinase family protein [Isoptericola sediminis]NNU26798.1 recombinase family protein [Isoptericola sediminis]
MDRTHREGTSVARVLGVVRLSRDREESTSPARQRESIEQWAQRLGHEVVGWAEDLDVSGAVAPWKRDELGQWLPATMGREASEPEEEIAWNRSRANEWDIICSWKLDRISRRALHTSQLHEWCKENGKQIASVEDGYDLTTPIGEFLFNILASFGQMELETIKFRAKASFNELVRQGRWRGGWLPYGYRAEPADDGQGYRLVVDDDGMNTAATLRDIVARVIDGESVNRVCASLNEQGVPAPMDAQRIREGNESKGALWRVGNLTKMLRSHTLLGWTEVGEKVKGDDGKVRRTTRLVRGDDGLPLQRAEPVIDRETFEKLQAVIDERKKPAGAAAKRADRSMLLGVAYCLCGTPLYAYTGGRGKRYYRCGRKAIAGARCEYETKSVRRDRLDGWVEQALLGTVGDVEVMQRTYRPGVDHSTEIADVLRALDELEDDRQAGLYATARTRDRFRAQHKALSARLDALEQLPSEPSGWDETPTGRTYREMWESLTTPQDKNTALRDLGVRAILHPSSLGGLSFEQMAPADGREYYTGNYGRVEIRTPAKMREAARHTVEAAESA